MNLSYRRKNKSHNKRNSKFKNKVKRISCIYNYSVLKTRRRIIDQKSSLKLFESRKQLIFKKFESFIDLSLYEEDCVIKFPMSFCFENNYKQSLKIIKSFVTNYIHNRNNIHLDFTNCNKVDVSAVFLFQILKKEIEILFDDFHNSFYEVNLLAKITWSRSGSKEVNRIMISCGFPKLNSMKEISSDDTKFFPQSTLGYFKGSAKQKGLLENKKGVCSKAVVDYVNNCLNEYRYELTANYKRNFNSIIGEVLSNCEDHSTFNTWFVHANFSKMEAPTHMVPKNINIDNVGELNLTILNFGECIYQSFIKTRNKNLNLYKSMEDKFQNISSKFTIDNLKLEQFIVLYLMTEGLSRFIYQDKSRGTGTIKFLNAFISLGDYFNDELKLYPKLSIYSGSTELVCDHINKPFKDENNVYLLTLNKEKSFNYPPDMGYLKNNEYFFPGTLISIKIYFDKSNLDGKINKNSNEN